MKKTSVAPARAVQVSLDINAPVNDVWAALASVEHLTNWLPTDAIIDGAPGGRYTISWEGGWEWATTIDTWQPPTRLRLIDTHARPFDTEGRKIAAEAEAELALEFTLESRGGTTVLTLVHSGFGQGDKWDDEVDGVSMGWQSELRGLKLYLERHLGRRRYLAWARRPSKLATEALWPLLVSPAGLILSGSTTAEAGEDVRVDLVTGDSVEGPVLFSIPGRQLLIQARNWGDGIFRIGADKAGGQSMPQVTLSAWRVAEADVKAFAARLQGVLDRLPL